MKSHEQLILGNSLETILAEQEKYMPVISEYQFQREVLDLLENPFEPERLQRYSLYVGELTKPLRVVENENRDSVLFQVPALVQSPITTIPRTNGITAENFLRSLSRDVDLGGRNVNDKILSFMMSITQVPNYVQQVIIPIQHILARYGRAMVALPGLDAPQVSVPVTEGPNSQQSSFSDEYED